MADQMVIENGKVVLTTEEGQRLERPEADLVDDAARRVRAAAGRDGPARRRQVLRVAAAAVAGRPPAAAARPPVPLDRRRLAQPVRRRHSLPQGAPERALRRSRSPCTLRRAAGSFLGGNNELYFRNEPLQSRADTPRLPGAAQRLAHRHAAPAERSWICTQYLEYAAGRRLDGAAAGAAGAHLERRLQPVQRAARRASWSRRSRRAFTPTCTRSSAGRRHRGQRRVRPGRAVEAGAAVASARSWTRLLRGARPASAAAPRRKKPPGLASRFMNLRTAEEEVSKQEALAMPDPALPEDRRADAAADRPGVLLADAGRRVPVPQPPVLPSDVPTRRPVKALAAHEPRCVIRYPKVPASTLEFIVGFFDRVYELHRSESVVLLLWDLEARRTRCACRSRRRASGNRGRRPLAAGRALHRAAAAGRPPARRRHPLSRQHGGLRLVHRPRTTSVYRDGVHGVVGRIEQRAAGVPPGTGHRRPPLRAGDGPASSRATRSARRFVPRKWLDRVSVKVEAAGGSRWYATPTTGADAGDAEGLTGSRRRERRAIAIRAGLRAGARTAGSR